MATPAQEAFAESFAALLEIHGRTWTRTGSASFVGVASDLRPDDPRMAGGVDRLIEIQVYTKALKGDYPQRGDEIISEGLIYRISHVQHDRTTRITTFTATLASSFEALVVDDKDESMTDGEGVGMTAGKPVSNQATDDQGDAMTDESGAPVQTSP